MRIIVLNFSLFWGLDLLKKFIFLGNCYLKLNQQENEILLMNTNKWARAFSKRFSQQIQAGLLFLKKTKVCSLDILSSFRLLFLQNYQALFIRTFSWPASLNRDNLQSGADSGLVMLVVMTNVFFNTKSKLSGSYALNR